MVEYRVSAKEIAKNDRYGNSIVKIRSRTCGTFQGLSCYNYDTSKEMQEHILKYGRDMERVSSIFVNCFPYTNCSMLLMGFNKRDEKKVKGYFYSFFREKEKYILRYLTNLFLFRCETWVCSDTFYDKYVSGVEKIYAEASTFSCKELNERRMYPLNFFENDFKKQLIDWRKINLG